MEKIWGKKELYKLSYEFLNFMEFFGFYFDFSGIFPDLILLEKWQKGFDLSSGTRRVDVAHGRHVAGPREPTWMPTWSERSSGWQVMGPWVSGPR